MTKQALLLPEIEDEGNIEAGFLLMISNHSSLNGALLSSVSWPSMAFFPRARVAAVPAQLLSLPVF